MSLCHGRFLEESFSRLFSDRRFPIERAATLRMILNIYIWEVWLCKSSVWIQSDFHCSLFASHLLKRTGCKQGIRLSSHGASAQKFGLTFFDALPPMILFHLLLVVKALFAWSCIQVCGTLGGYPGGDALRCLFDSFRQLLDFCMWMLCHFVRGGLCG